MDGQRQAISRTGPSYRQESDAQSRRPLFVSTGSSESLFGAGTRTIEHPDSARTEDYQRYRGQGGEAADAIRDTSRWERGNRGLLRHYLEARRGKGCDHPGGPAGDRMSYGASLTDAYRHAPSTPVAFSGAPSRPTCRSSTPRTAHAQDCLAPSGKSLVRSWRSFLRVTHRNGRVGWKADVWLSTPAKRRADCVQPHFCATSAQAILKSLGGDFVAWRNSSLE